jgi:hypothetical protein
MHNKRGGKAKAVNENRGDIGGRNRLEQYMEQAAALERDYDNAVNDKPGSDNSKAMDYLVQAVNILTQASNDV